MAPTILFSHEVDPDKIVLEDPKSSKTGSSVKSSNVGYRHGENSDAKQLLIQLPRMRVPFGITNNEKFGDGKKWELNFSFNGEERNKKIQRFRSGIKQIDGKIIDSIHECCEEHFGKELKPEILAEFYKGGVKTSKNPKYADNFKVHLGMRKDDTPHAEFFDKQKNAIDWKEVQPGSEAVAIVSLTRVWSATGTKQFGPTWKLIQMQVFKAERLTGFQIKEEDDDDDSDSEEEEEIVESDDDLEK